MTILFYAPIEIFDRPTGTGIYVRNLFEALLRADPESHYLIWYGCFLKTPKGIVPPLTPQDQGRVETIIVRFPTRLFRHPVTLSVLWHLRFFPLADFLFHRPQIFFSPFLPFLPYRNGALVLTIFDLTPFTHPHCHPPARIYQAAVTLRWAKGAKHLLTFSRAVKDQIVTLFNIPHDHITVTPLAARKIFFPRPPGHISAVCKKYGLTDPYLLFVGTIEPRKNLTTLLQAFVPLTRDFPHRIVLAGARGWGSRPVFTESDRPPLKGRVFHLGYVPDEDLPALISGATLFLYPSLAEGFGLPPLEAMACGTPVLCSDAPALPEVVGDAAVTVPPKEVEAWTEALKQLLGDKDLRDELRRKGLERAKQFSWDETAHRTLLVFRDAAIRAHPKTPSNRRGASSLLTHFP